MTNSGARSELESAVQAHWEFLSPEERPLWAWLAGIIDGEGSIAIERHCDKTKKYWSFNLRLAVGMTHSPTIKRIRQITNVGHIYEGRSPSRNRWRPMFLWVATGSDAAGVLRRCYLYLVTKREQAAVALTFVASRQLTSHVGLGHPVPMNRSQRWVEMRDQISRLNRGDLDLYKVLEPEG